MFEARNRLKISLALKSFIKMLEIMQSTVPVAVRIVAEVHYMRLDIAR